MPEPCPEIYGYRQDGKRACDPDAHGHERFKPEPEAKLRQDETGKHELGKGIGLAHEKRIDGDGARQHPRQDEGSDDEDVATDDGDYEPDRQMVSKSERQINADEQDLVLGGLHVSMMETGRSIRRLP